MSTATSATSTSTIIETCWSTIETFTDLESTILLSRTCRSLHSLLVDTATRKIKVSHFQVVNLPPPEGNNNHLVGFDDETSGGSIDIPRNYTTAHIRIPHYTSNALDHIHFPSLRKLHLDFPLSRKRRVIGDNRKDFIEDVHTAAFPTFVTQLAYAANLQSLHLDINRLLQHEKGGILESLYERFGQNLARCSNTLEELSIVNMGYILGENHPKYSAAMADALIPTLRRGKLRVFSYKVNGNNTFQAPFVGSTSPADVSWLSRRNIEAFSAAIQSENLEKLDVDCSFGTFTDFVEAASCCSERRSTLRKPQSINDLNICCRRPIDGEGMHQIPRIGPMLDCFSECPLQVMSLNIPNCWSSPEFLQALTNLVNDKPQLRILVINPLMVFDDRDGKVAKCLEDISRVKVSEMGDIGDGDFFLSVHGLSNFNKKKFCKKFRNRCRILNVGPNAGICFSFE